MDIQIVQDTCTIVLLANIKDPYYIQADWMHDRGIINEDEWTQVKDVLVLPDQSRFNIDGVFTFYCDKTRIQIGTNDISKSNRLSAIVINIITSLSYDTIKAVGVNSERLFLFPKKEDYDAFGNILTPYSKWQSLMQIPSMTDICLTENISPDKDNAKKTLRITEVGVEGKNNCPVFNANVNYHYTVNGNQEAVDVLQDSPSIHEAFRTSLATFIRELA